MGSMEKNLEFGLRNSEGYYYSLRGQGRRIGQGAECIEENHY